MDRNYKEDQSNEIEALDSIYCGDMEILETEPFHKFKIPIMTEEYNADEENGLSCNLVFTYTNQYPDKAPIFEIEDAINFEDNYERLLLEYINEKVVSFLGIEMIFSLVSSAQEWLNERWDDHKRNVENERVRKLEEVEEAERKRFEGTRVSVETFLTWRMGFEEDMGITAKREKCLAENKKLTGKELFLRDNTLNESDIKFLLEAGDPISNVKIDEDLFQSLADLELEDFDGDDDDDDEDYVPGDISD